MRLFNDQIYFLTDMCIDMMTYGWKLQQMHPETLLVNDVIIDPRRKLAKPNCQNASYGSTSLHFKWFEPFDRFLSEQMWITITYSSLLSYRSLLGEGQGFFEL